MTPVYSNGALWAVVGSLTGGLRTILLAPLRTRSGLASALAVDALVGIGGALASAGFVWPLHGILGSYGIAVSGMLWAFVGSLFTLCLRQVVWP